MTSEEGDVDFRIVNGEAEETGFELVEARPEVGLVPVKHRSEIVPRE